MTSPPRSLGASLLRSPRVFLLSLWPLRAFAYMLVSAIAPALVYYGAGLVVSPVLVPVALTAVAALCFLLAWVDRRRVALVGIDRIPSAHVPVRGGAWKWLAVRAREPATWRELAAGIVSLAIGIVAAVIAVLDIGAVGAVVLYFSAPQSSRLDPSVWGVLGSAPDRSVPEVVVLVSAILLAYVLVHAYVVAVVALGHARLVVLLLSPREAELEAIVESLAASRRSLLTSFDEERRAIERQLHDGVQQRLVSLVMSLGMAEVEAEVLERRGADAAGLRRSLADAHSNAEGALADLRRTVRGVHPPVLVEHGLLAAIDEIAGRTAIPTRVVGDLPSRLPAPVEQCAYYVVSEALTNAMKHSGASAIEVRLDASDDRLTVTVRDDGRGGALVRDGASPAGAARGGLAGLAERATVLGGSVEVTSPSGGPTLVSLLLPLDAERLA